MIRSIIEGNDLIILITDKKLIINEEHYSSKIESQLFGKDIESLHGKRIYEIIPESAVSSLKKTIVNCSKTGEPQNVKLTIRENPVNIINLYVDRLKEKHNDTEYEYLFILKDITDIREHQEYFTIFYKIFSRSLDGIAIMNAEGEYILQNEKHKNLLGIENKDLIGKKPDTIFGEPHFKRMFEETLQNDCFRGEFAIKAKKGIRRSFSLSAFPIRNDKKQINYIITVVRDISESKETEYKLRHLNSTKDKLFSIIAHDLKSPFNSILGLSEIIHENYESYTISEIRELLDLMRSTTENTYNLLINLLQWAQMQKGHIQYKPTAINLKELLENILNIFNNSALKKGIQFVDTVPEEVFVWSDENMIQTVLRNILDNAIKYSKKNGRIFIDVNLLKNKVKITISDNGIGMPESIRKSLFDITEKVVREGTDKEKGSGLGLILCKEFIEHSGGKLTVKSIDQKGTSISFTLPVPSRLN